MIFALKLYPQTIWGNRYNGNFRMLLDHIASLNIQSIIVPVFQGSRLFFPESGKSTMDRWNLVDFQRLAREYKIVLIPEFPVFHDPDTYQTIPQYRPVSLKGDTNFPSSWYRPVCPSNPHYRQYRLDLIYQAIDRFEPRIISLDFLHYPYLPGPEGFDEDGTSLPQYCYCDFCRYQYLDFSGKSNPLDDIESWFLFRCENITLIPVSIAEHLEKRTASTSVLIQLPVVSTPFFLERLRRLSGQDLSQWRGLVDVVSPHFHVFHLNLNTEFLQDVLEEIREMHDMKILPEIDFPPDSFTKEHEDIVRETLRIFADKNIEVVSLFHANLVLQNEPIRKMLAEFSE